jgi:hypothetical protein
MSTKTEKQADQKAAKSKGDDHSTRSPEQEKLAEGEHITQRKPTIEEGMKAGTGPNATLESVGKGSVEELAPAVRSAISDGQADRVVQQGDEVIVHGRAIIDGQTSMHGLVLKVNQDSTIAVRVQRTNGQTFDVPGPVKNADAGDGSFYWTWPAEDELTDKADSRKRKRA